MCMGNSFKILYFVDYLPDVPNSVGNILNVLLNNLLSLGVNQVVAQRPELNYSVIQKRVVNGFVAYTGDYNSKFDVIKTKIIKKFKDIDNLRVDGEIKYLNSLIQLEKPDLIFFLIFNPEKHLAEFCKNNGIKNYWMLYDTYVSRPGQRISEAIDLEEKVMELSRGYYVPSFFYDDYCKYYKNENLKSYNLPLLIPKFDVNDAYSKRDFENGYEYTYFGQVQAFRNADKIKEICRKINIKIDVFTTDDLESDDVFIVHKAVSGEKLFQIVAQSKYLVVFDNSKPYDNYLPSKVFLYVSFTKPVIAFGNNTNSALLRFFEEYPSFFYQNFNESYSDLNHFIKGNVLSSFNPTTYDKYSSYLPEKALEQLISSVQETISQNA